eukprot:3925412-Amphidinium_carterae.3
MHHQQACTFEFIRNLQVELAGAGAELEVSAVSDLPIRSSSFACRTGVSFVTSTFAELPFSLPRSIMEQPLFDFGLTVPVVEQPKHTSPVAESSVSHGLTLLTVNIRSLNEAGKLKFLTDQLLALKVDIAFVQETRLPASFENSQVGQYHLISSPALESAGAHGGLMVLIKAEKQTTLLSHSLVCHRILSVSVRILGKMFRLISAHAPIAESPSEDHELFAAQL